jgi:mono/diheme cytochrome c family protein
MVEDDDVTRAKLVSSPPPINVLACSAPVERHTPRSPSWRAPVARALPAPMKLLLPALLLVGIAINTSPGAVPDSSAAAGAQAEFANTCSRCHNTDGSGYPALGIPNFGDPNWQAQHPDPELKAAIHDGRNGRMPPFGAVLSAAQIDALIQYVVRPFGQAAKGTEQQRAAPQPPPEPIEPDVAPPGYGSGPVTLGAIGVYTQHNDNARTGANLHETVLTPANVKPGRFGLLFRYAVDDQVFAQPLYVPNLAIGGSRHNVVIVATAANTLYAFDADRDTVPYWQVNLGAPGSVQQHKFWCLDILGNMGIIGTPVIDPATQTLYVVALTHEGNGWVQRLHALSVVDGSERPHSPVVIATAEFDPILQNQRPALLLSRGGLYVGYASHCDVEPYHGFLFRFDPQTLALRGVLNLSPGAKGNSIWQSGQGPAADDAGNIFLVTSNGTWDGKLNLSDSFLKLDPEMHLLDWFTPTNYLDLDKRDHDLNSSGAMLLPGTNLVLGAGKEGVVYVVDRNHLGHLGDPQAVQHFRAAKGEINVGVVYWKSAAQGELLYVWGQDDSLQVFRFKDGKFEPQPLYIGAETSAYPGGILSISANGDKDGLLWVNAALTAHGNGHVNGPAVLRVYDAADPRHELWDSNLDGAHDRPGRISKNAPPTVVNGKVYLASFGTLPVGTGALYVYGLLPTPRKSSEPAKNAP